MSDWLENKKQSPDFYRCEQMGQNCYFLQWQDGSGGIYNAEGKPINSPMRDHDVISNFTKLGELDGVHYCAFEGLSFGGPNDRYVTMMNERGQQVWFKDPRECQCFGKMETTKQAFQKLQALSQEYKANHSSRQATEQLQIGHQKLSLFQKL